MPQKTAAKPLSLNGRVLDEVETYLKVSSISATAFGTALGDPMLVFELRKGKRDLRASTIDKIRGHIRGEVVAAFRGQRG